MKRSAITEITVSIGIIFSLIFADQAYSQIDFPAQSVYRYLKGNEAQSLSSGWVNPDFDDSAWDEGIAPFRYGDGEGGTELTDMNGNYSTVFMRSTFQVENPDDINSATFSVNWDDGFALWINGQEVLSQQRPGSITYDALSSDLHESGTNELFTIDTEDLNLLEGENTLAVFACNTSLSGSSDFYIDLSITAVAQLSNVLDSADISFSHESGFYDSNFDLTVSTTEPDAYIVYTLDGSNPQTSSTRVTGQAITSITIDPANTTNRGSTPGVVIRASVGKDGFTPSKSKSHCFIFLSELRTQTNPGWDWPQTNINEQVIDYGMDPDVVNSAEYSDIFDDAMLAIPTLSIVTDNANLFDPEDGIYVNADQHGKIWEKECTVELLNPDGSEGFNVHAGLRIRGGWSRHDNYPKHAFRLFFRSEYGDSKLRYPLFGEEGVDQFDKVDLRCAQNYSWAMGWDGDHNTFIREVMARDVQGESGHPYTRSRYYHLYINGLYWGLYQTQERSEARWASDYLGGDNDDYDVMKKSNINYSGGMMATDGNEDTWIRLFNLTENGFSSNANYFKLEGRDKNGDPKKNSEVLVDIDNLIDFMINIFYSGNFDSPTSAYANNKSAANFYAVKDRTDKSTGFIFLIHDAEHSLMTEATGPGIGLYENRVNIGYRTGDDKMEISGWESFNPQWLHHKLCSNKEYKVRFADLAWKRLHGDGLFTPESNIERMNFRAEQIEMAIIGESARWGDMNTSIPFTKDNAWLPELNALTNDYFPYRTDIVIDQLKEYDLFPDVDAPVIRQNGTEITGEQLFIDYPSGITLNNSSGVIYYTLDGTDPRKTGGSIATEAKMTASGASIPIEGSSVIKARVYKDGEWSALVNLDVVAQQENYTHFKVTELHYHPTDSIAGTDTISGKSYEFIEFKNTGGENAINLTGVTIDSAIYFEFPENTLLAPGQYYVVAAKPKKFYDRYGRIADGNFSKSFSNSGEQVLVLAGDGTTIMDFTYDDHSPWPEAPDGDGPSLVSVEINPTGDPDEYTYWTYSKQIHGSPGTDGSNTGPASTIVNEFADMSVSVYPNPTSDKLNIQIEDNQNAEYEFKLYDLNGSLVYMQTCTGTTGILLSDLNIPHGIYMINIQSESKTTSMKVIYMP
ncbi:MAG: CotH kinase family protein [Bacteroidales bacterium]|jgi:hypothetical protein